MKGTAADRLRYALRQRGIDEYADFARDAGVGPGTLRQQLNRGSIPKGAADKYARKLKIPAEWLLYGRGADPFGEAAAESGSTLTMLIDSSVVWVDELDVRAAAGKGGSALDISTQNEGDYVVGRYAFPARAFEETFGAQQGRVRICNIVGNSMTPDLLPGQRVMVDLGDKSPSPPGVFFVYDGLGIVCKLVEYIPHSEPARVRISSKNADFQAYERNLDEAYICGRVIGVWQRT